MLHSVVGATAVRKHRNDLSQASFLKFVFMNKISAHFRESYRELVEKVTWPTWAQLQQSTVIVLVATLLITAMVWVMDIASENLLKLLYSFFK